MQHDPDRALISVIVPTFQDAHELQSCLEALRTQDTCLPFEVIVVNSDSKQHIDLPDGLPGRVVNCDLPLAPGAARNCGAKHSKAKYLAFTDADCQPAASWLRAATTALDSGLDLVGGVVKNLRPLNPIAVTDNLLQFTDYSPGRPRGETDHLPGCNMAVRRGIFEDVGGFDEDSPSGEDVMLAEAISRRDPSRAVFEPSLVVRHEGRRTLSAMWNHQKSFGFHRARLGLRLQSSMQQRLRSPAFAGYFCMRRFIYLAYRNASWYASGFPRFLLLVPWLAIALAAYGVGLHRGAGPAMNGDG